jgi:hypothetical protein
MGTRSLTFVYDNETPVVCMYRQYDGYPGGHGVELANFLNSVVEVTNGISSNEKRKTANGMGCLAAQMICDFKSGVGGIYLYPTNTEDAYQDYEYHVHKDHVKVTNPNNVIFSGSWQEFFDFCSEEEIG